MKYILMFVMVFSVSGCFDKSVSGKVYIIKGDGSIINAASRDTYLITMPKDTNLQDILVTNIMQKTVTQHCEAVAHNNKIHLATLKAVENQDKGCEEFIDYETLIATKEKQIVDLVEEAKELHKKGEYLPNQTEIDNQYNELVFQADDLGVRKSMQDSREKLCNALNLQGDYLEKYKCKGDKTKTFEIEILTEVFANQYSINGLAAIAGFEIPEQNYKQYPLGLSDESIYQEALNYMKDNRDFKTVTNVNGDFEFTKVDKQSYTLVSSYSDDYTKILWIREIKPDEQYVELNNTNASIILNK